MKWNKQHEKTFAQAFFSYIISFLNGESVQADEKVMRAIETILRAPEAHGKTTIAMASTLSYSLNTGHADAFVEALRRLRWKEVEISEIPQVMKDLIRSKPEFGWTFVNEKIFFSPDFGRTEIENVIEAILRPEYGLPKLYSLKGKPKKLKGLNITGMFTTSAGIQTFTILTQEMEAPLVWETVKELSPSERAVLVVPHEKGTKLYWAAENSVNLLGWGPKMEKLEDTVFYVYNTYSTAPLVGLTGTVKNGTLNSVWIGRYLEGKTVSVIGRKTGERAVVPELWTEVSL